MPLYCTMVNSCRQIDSYLIRSYRAQGGAFARLRPAKPEAPCRRQRPSRAIRRMPLPAANSALIAAILCAGSA